ncbi:MAG: hypothetical protein AAF577_17565 [Pseudomonadota bacterium]
MIVDYVFGLAAFKLVGGVVHAAMNITETRRMREQGENPYQLPAVYQRYTSPAELTN